MATADFGAIEICGPLSLSPLIDLLRAWITRKRLAIAWEEAVESRVVGLGSERDMMEECASRTSQNLQANKYLNVSRN